jgi:vacuolar-type H+-ATPase subunit I/STV1
MAEIEFAGMKFQGGRIAILITALSTLGGASWAGFEFYKDYMDMREIVQSIDVDTIEARNLVIETKLDEAIDYTRDIKSGLRDDILSIEKQADRAEDKVRALEVDVRESIDNAEERFEVRRDKLKDDYDEALAELRKEIEELEKELDDKLQKALDNPLSDN